MPPSLPLLVGLLATLAPGMAQQPAEGNALLDHALASVRSLSSAGLVTPEEEQAAVRRMVQMDDRLLVSLLACSNTRALMAHASQPFSHPRSNRSCSCLRGTLRALQTMRVTCEQRWRQTCLHRPTRRTRRMLRLRRPRCSRFTGASRATWRTCRCLRRRCGGGLKPRCSRRITF